MSFDLQEALFHVGSLVDDIEAAMAELTATLGLTWTELVEREQPIWTPAGGATTVPLRFAYSCDAPVHVELLQGAAGSFWDAAGRAGVHHLGVWVDDVGAEVERLVADGWTLEMAQRSPADGYGVMAYVRSPAGVLVEPVASVVRPRFDRWWAGGPLG